jgi:hypothetical protein
MDKHYQTNCPLKAPGLVIKAGSSALAKAGSAFRVKQNGIISDLIAANTDMTALSSAEGVGGATTTNLADDMCRIYTFLASVNEDTGAVTLSAVHGDDFSVSRPPKMSDINFGNAEVDSDNNVVQGGKLAVIGFLLVINETNADFVPGTTALDVANLTTQYIDNYGFVGV